MSASERIIADCGNVQSGTSDLCQWEHWGDLVEYNRTDLCDPMQDERVRALVEAAKDFQNFVSLAAPELTDEDRGACAGGVEIDIALEEALAALTAYREARK